MITNPAWFALLPAILLASFSSVSAKERILPAVSGPVQVIALNMTMHAGKVTSDAPLFSHTPLSKNNSLSCASCYMLESGEDDNKTGQVRLKGFGRVSLPKGISVNKRDPVQINREKS